jgi:hypothetical protein
MKQRDESEKMSLVISRNLLKQTNSAALKKRKHSTEKADSE